MYFAEAKGAYWQVIHHDAPVLLIPGLRIQEYFVHRECHPACGYDSVALDFVSDDEAAWYIAARLNLGLARIAQGGLEFIGREGHKRIVGPKLRNLAGQSNAAQTNRRSGAALGKRPADRLLGRNR